MTDRGRLAFFWGEDPFLLRLAARSLLERLGVRAMEVTAADWQGGETSDLATPSLWGDRRGLLVIGCESLPEHGDRELRGYLATPDPDAACVLTQVSRAKATPPLGKLVLQGGGIAEQVAVRRQELPRWVVRRGKDRGIEIAQAAAAVLVQAVGEDTATLDQAVEQLASAFAGRIVRPEDVHEQFGGLGEQRGWELCDHALAGRLPQALVVLRSLLQAREEPLLILGVIASRLRDLVRVRSIPERTPTAEAARAAGLRFDWQVRRYREQSARFGPDELNELHRRVAEADRALKGGMPGDVVLAALVAEMAGQHGATLRVPVRVSR